MKFAIQETIRNKNNSERTTLFFVDDFEFIPPVGSMVMLSNDWDGTVEKLEIVSSNINEPYKNGLILKDRIVSNVKEMEKQMIKDGWTYD